MQHLLTLVYQNLTAVVGDALLVFSFYQPFSFHFSPLVIHSSSVKMGDEDKSSEKPKNCSNQSDSDEISIPDQQDNPQAHYESSVHESLAATHGEPEVRDRFEKQEISEVLARPELNEKPEMHEVGNIKEKETNIKPKEKLNNDEEEDYISPGLSVFYTFDAIAIV